jgi:thiol-disulfide isomerase/thioredoxin
LVFGTAGVAKLLDLSGSRKSLSEFGVPAGLTHFLALLLPLVELACAFAVIPITSAWWGATGAFVLLVLFTVAIGINLVRGRRPACHCFGQLHSAAVGWTTLLRNAVLAAVAGLIVWQGPTSPGAGLTNPLSSFSRFEVVVFAVAAAMVLLAGLGLMALVFLLRQNGRLLLRLDALEARLGPEAEAPVAGLPVDSIAPEFSLEALDGRMVTLESLRDRAKPLMLFFTESGCGACDSALPELAKWQVDHKDQLSVIPIARGDAKANLAKSRKYHIQDVLFGNQDVAQAYGVDATPSAVLVSRGLIASPIAAGIDAIRELVSTATMPPPLKRGDLIPSLHVRDLNGGSFDLASLRRRQTLLLLWDPACGFCQRMLDDIKEWERERNGAQPELVVVSAGSRQANKKQGFRSLVLLDSGFRVGQLLGGGGTPSAVLVDEQGRIASEVGVGAPAVLALAGAAPLAPVLS